MSKKHIILFAFAIVTFIIGFILIAFTAWWLNGIAGVSVEDFSWEISRRGVLATGAYTIVGLALVSIGMIVTLLTKLEK
jgi:hypothetical protein